MYLFEYSTWFHSSTGVIHTFFALLSMVLGSWVLLKRKGTTIHKRIGHAYVASMILLNATSFGMHTFGAFGPFHFAAVMSLGTVIAGIIPAIRRKNSKWVIQHYYFMSWSVVGLYAAFWSEVGTRVIDIKLFWWAVALATGLTVAIGARVIKKQAKLRFG